MASVDEEVADQIAWCKRLGVRIHVRGTDENPVVELKDRASGRIVGGIELRKRAEIAGRGTYT